ncbi:MAG: hypothetical protein ACT4NU_13345 [Chromatiales bacterium]
MFTVALIGPDGVGKTTIAKRLEASLPLPTKYLYMGLNPDACNYMLPTTRWWEKRKAKRKSVKGAMQDDTKHIQSARRSDEPGNLTHSSAPHGPPKPIAAIRAAGKALIKGVGLVNRILEEWYRQLITYHYSGKGYVVIFDRHFICDFYHHDIEPEDDGASLKRKLHGFVLRHTLPEPDLVICLDAPGEVVFERKGEFTPELMEVRRSQYLDLRHVVKNFAVIDANRELDIVVTDVMAVIHRFNQNWLNSAQDK